MTNPSILPIGIDGSVEQQPAVPSSITRRGLVALAAATALTVLSGQVGAETPAVSATASTSKGVGGQMTSDGRDFSVLTEKDVKGLARAEKEKYYAWKEAQLDATIIAEKKGLEGDKAIEISEYEIMISNFIVLAKNGKTGEKIYGEMKGKLRKVLDSGKPPELIARLESIRQLLI